VYAPENPFINAQFNFVMCLFFIYLHKPKKDIMFVYAQILPTTTIGVVELFVGNAAREPHIPYIV
jgi:hypothetical protein